jgi:hypothetical protein
MDTQRHPTDHPLDGLGGAPVTVRRADRPATLIEIGGLRLLANPAITTLSSDSAVDRWLRRSFVDALEATAPVHTVLLCDDRQLRGPGHAVGLTMPGVPLLASAHVADLLGSGASASRPGTT